MRRQDTHLIVAKNTAHALETEIRNCDRVLARKDEVCLIGERTENQPRDCDDDEEEEKKDVIINSPASRNNIVATEV